LTFVSKRRTSNYSIEPFRHCLQLLSDQERRWRTTADLLSPTAGENSRQRSARQRLQRAMSSAAGAAGIDPDTMYPHRLRRTYAEAFYAEVRGDLVRLRDHMGWADINTAARYVTRDRREELDAIAAKMRKKRKRRKN
jgi:integrase